VDRGQTIASLCSTWAATALQRRRAAARRASLSDLMNPIVLRSVNSRVEDPASPTRVL
jgi:hypothetical protein